ncbi:response regulator transcription factor [Fusibacter ferrireducens]|uniref:Stage 0 sporulation protein A homolog n=1 Tax=Fusibacter ferrireducens TaxID=2785058 RepID=A0ABR9ZME7_9FIRM|nr:response regulator [Fusibacter ferrireducens]MBF4691625.1 response regulator [Fusibacter ferrireducens]
MYKILIVEDDLLLNKTLAYNLAADGFDVVSAYSCASALQQLRKSQFDLALLDINLPDGSGLDLCRTIKSQYADTYSLFLTANDQERDMIKGYEAGGFDYITKPFSIAVLCKKIAALFETMHKQSPKHDLYYDGILKIDFSEQIAQHYPVNMSFQSCAQLV